MTKTLAQLKRDIAAGVVIEWVKLEELGYSNKAAGLQPVEIKPERKTRTVSVVDTTGFYLKNEHTEAGKKGSFCGWPKAAELDYSGDVFTITEIDHHGDVWQKRTYKIIK